MRHIDTVGCFLGQFPCNLSTCFQGWAWYRKFFQVPNAWRGRRVWLKIGGVASEGTFTVNGKSVARINPYCGSWKYEITDLIAFGVSNEVAAVISNRTPSRRGGSLASNHWGGLWRDVEIEATPEVLIDDAWVRGDFDKRFGVGEGYRQQVIILP